MMPQLAKLRTFLVLLLVFSVTSCASKKGEITDHQRSISNNCPATGAPGETIVCPGYTQEGFNDDWSCFFDTGHMELYAECHLDGDNLSIILPNQTGSGRIVSRHGAEGPFVIVDPFTITGAAAGGEDINARDETAGDHGPGCVGNDDCMRGQVCQAGRCVDSTPPPRCNSNADCTTGGNVCRDHICGPCAATSECTAPLVCSISDHTCATPPCARDSDCTTGGMTSCRLSDHVCVAPPAPTEPTLTATAVPPPSGHESERVMGLVHVVGSIPAGGTAYLYGPFNRLPVGFGTCGAEHEIPGDAASPTKYLATQDNGHELNTDSHGVPLTYPAYATGEICTADNCQRGTEDWERSYDVTASLHCKVPVSGTSFDFYTRIYYPKVAKVALVYRPASGEPRVVARRVTAPTPTFTSGPTAAILPSEPFIRINFSYADAVGTPFITGCTPDSRSTNPAASRNGTGSSTFYCPFTAAGSIGVAAAGIGTLFENGVAANYRINCENPTLGLTIGGVYPPTGGTIRPGSCPGFSSGTSMDPSAIARWAEGCNASVQLDFRASSSRTCTVTRVEADGTPHAGSTPLTSTVPWVRDIQIKAYAPNAPFFGERRQEEGSECGASPLVTVTALPSSGSHLVQWRGPRNRDCSKYKVVAHDFNGQEFLSDTLSLPYKPMVVGNGLLEGTGTEGRTASIADPTMTIPANDPALMDPSHERTDLRVGSNYGFRSSASNRTWLNETLNNGCNYDMPSNPCNTCWNAGTYLACGFSFGASCGGFNMTTSDCSTRSCDHDPGCSNIGRFHPRQANWTARVKNCRALLTGIIGTHRITGFDPNSYEEQTVTITGPQLPSGGDWNLTCIPYDLSSPPPVKQYHQRSCQPERCVMVTRNSGLTFDPAPDSH